ncbi:hypothetical protein JTE90_028306 [Oedothorax gibbosus]|uniref:Uncharacterized protein n=1 Tax=Oedothorax gibbosus TaxID=931172 RepID=A0AAV6TZT5_9ARAC|nr:hypothetical protein JTE90_028306 [Oedothorax gibbosus]
MRIQSLQTRASVLTNQDSRRLLSVRRSFYRFHFLCACVSWRCLPPTLQLRRTEDVIEDTRDVQHDGGGDEDVTPSLNGLLKQYTSSLYQP